MKFRFYALWLCLVCIVIFIVQLTLSGFTESLLLNAAALFEPWRFITAMFLHGSVMHLAYNLFALGLFGSMLERLIGGKRFLTVFFVTGIGANILSVFFYESSLGASGAIFGVIGALIVVRPSLPVFAFGLPMPIFIAGILWTIGDLVGLFIPSNVANLAHLAGLAIGLVFGALYRQWRREIHRVGGTYLDEPLMRKWEDNYLR